MRDGPALVLACLGAGPRRPGRELGPFECHKNKIIVEEKLKETQNEVSFNQRLDRSATLRSRRSTVRAQHENGKLHVNMSPSAGACTGLPGHPSHCCSPSSIEESAMLQQSQHGVRTYGKNIQTCAIQVNETPLILQQRQESSTMPTPLAQQKKTLKSCSLLLWKSQRLSIPPLLRTASSKASAGLCRCLSHNSCRTESRLTTFCAQVWS